MITSEDVAPQPSSTRPPTLEAARQNKRYWNKIAIQTQEGVFSTNSEARAIQLMKRFQRKYPDQKPVLGYIPPGSSILIPRFEDVT